MTGGFAGPLRVEESGRGYFAGIVATVHALARADVPYLKSLVSLELTFLFTVSATFMTEVGRGGPEIYNQITRIGGMIGVSLLVVTLPRFVNSRPPLTLIHRIDVPFTAAGTALLIHYVISAAIHFTSAEAASFGRGV